MVKEGKNYVLIGGQRFQVVSYPDSFFRATRKKAQQFQLDLEEENSRREAERIMLEKAEAAKQREVDLFVQKNTELLLIRLYMSLS